MKIQKYDSRLLNIVIDICIVIFVLLIVLVLTHCKTSNHNYAQQSNIDPRNTVVYNKKGKAKGYWQQSVIDPRKSVYHKK